MDRPGTICRISWNYMDVDMGNFLPRFTSVVDGNQSSASLHDLLHCRSDLSYHLEQRSRLLDFKVLDLLVVGLADNHGVTSSQRTMRSSVGGNATFE